MPPAQIHTPRAAATSFAIGLAFWSFASALNPERDVLDGPGFVFIAYPAAILLSGGLGYVFPVTAWRWALILFAALLPVMVVISLTGDMSLGLLPLALILILVLSLPGAVAALAAAAFRRWQLRRQKRD